MTLHHGRPSFNVRQDVPARVLGCFLRYTTVVTLATSTFGHETHHIVVDCRLRYRGPLFLHDATKLGFIVGRALSLGDKLVQQGPHLLDRVEVGTVGRPVVDELDAVFVEELLRLHSGVALRTILHEDAVSFLELFQHLVCFAGTFFLLTAISFF